MSLLIFLMRDSRRMLRNGIDVLMVTHNRPTYTRKSLGELLNRSDSNTRIWVWHNGTDGETLEALKPFRSHLFRFRHSVENVLLTDPLNWLLSEARGSLLGKVDDDCIVPEQWDLSLKEAHDIETQLGVAGCWRFQDEDFDPALAEKKIISLPGGHKILANMWVEGSGFLLKHQCVEKLGLLKQNQSFPKYCRRISRHGWMNGWIYPFLRQDHMDDPRSNYTGLTTNEDFLQRTPLTAKKAGVSSLDEWLAHIKADAIAVQKAPIRWALHERILARVRGKLDLLMRYFRPPSRQ